MRFGSYNLNKELVDALNTLGYVEATPIQEKVLAKALKGKSLICKSETGSGKTHAFLIPILNNIDKTEVDNDIGIEESTFSTTTTIEEE